METPTKKIAHVLIKEDNSLHFIATRHTLEALQRVINKLISSNKSNLDATMTDVETATGERYDIVVSMQPESSIEEANEKDHKERIFPL